MCNLEKALIRLIASSLIAVSALAVTAPVARAQCGSGGGAVLGMPDTAGIGTTVTVTLDAPPPVTTVLFLASLGQGPINGGAYGTICLDFPTIISIVLVLDANGHAELTGDIPCDPAFVGITLYAQFLTCAPGSEGRTSKGSSNQESLTITDGLCDGDLCTFTQGGWGTTCSGNNPGCRRDKWFDTVFPNGVTIGDVDGIDGGGDGEFALLFTSSAAVEDFLPAGKTPGTLDDDATDPTSSSAGVFAGQLLSATLNVAFDDAGALDDCKGRDDLRLGDLLFLSGVDADLLGFTVDDLLVLANAAISGGLGSGPFDLDGNGSDDVTLSDISDALTTFNENFDDGTTNNGHLGIP